MTADERTTGTGAGAGAGAETPEAFEYAVLRVVPRVDRGETMNAGVLLYCRPRRYLGARISLDEALLLALDPAADVAGVRRALLATAEVCAGSDGTGRGGGAGGNRAGSGGAGDAVAGPAQVRDIGRRFRWLTAPRSTVVQAGPVHTGLTADPDAEIDRLLTALVERPR